MRRAIYAGSFDPTTNGHMWVVEQGAQLFDELIVVIGQNPSKKGHWPVEERVAILTECCAHLPNVKVRVFDGRYLVRVAAELGAKYLLRGVRNATDFAYEQTIRNVNSDLEPSVETIFVMTPREIAEISSSTVRGMVGFEGWQDVVKKFVPPPVFRRMTRV
ncbi:MAG: pantetheine-phosphate adenylyltransferase [Archangium sp.]|nr:pantetheine-phosphate adenylyltransferase [Archangium sp.]